MSSYIEIDWSDLDKVEKLLDIIEIDYDVVDSKNVLDYDETKLEDASEAELIDELKKRGEKYDVVVPPLYDRNRMKDFIREALGLNNIASVEDVISEINELFKL